jgi:tetratricopeptide (TPR) repeat protein
MSASTQPISLFVAMPYTQMGTDAKWGKPQSVAAFYEQVRKRIAQKMKRKVVMRIEKDTPKSGLVIGEMFQAIRDADIFIADITGSNANVFLELGVRYGVSNQVTILTTQEDKAPPFDINQIAVVRYADGPTQNAEKRIADIVYSELNTTKGGSPILSLLDAQVVPRRQWELFSGERIQLMIHQARQESEAGQKLRILQEAVDVDPFSLPAQIELIGLLRATDQLEAALQANDQAARRFPRCMPLLKERGRVLDRLSAKGEDRLDEAIEAFSQALLFAESDADLHGCLGGVLRRKALRSSGTIASGLLNQAFQHYFQSLKADRHSTYAGMNLMRLIMLGATPTADFSGSEEEYLTRMFHLCAFEVSDTQCLDKGEKWWPMFDLGDVLLLQNHMDRAIATYNEAIAAIPPHARRDQLLSPLRTWKELLESGSLKHKQDASNAENIIQLLESQAAVTQPM